MTKIVTRQEIKELLHRWQNGDLSHKSVYDWAAERYDSQHWDVEDEIAGQVLTELYSLHMNLTTPEDIPHLLKLLSVPRGQIGNATALNRDYSRSVNLNARRLALSKDPMYGPYCKLSK